MDRFRDLHVAEYGTRRPPFRRRPSPPKSGPTACLRGARERRRPMTQATRAHLDEEVRQMIAEREREGIMGLAGEVSPAQWADLIPRLDGLEIAALVTWLPEELLADTLAEIDPVQAARILRALSREA